MPIPWCEETFSFMPPVPYDLDHIDPFSKCMHTDHPCAPGSRCAMDEQYPCTPDCGDYVSYSEEDPNEDR